MAIEYVGGASNTSSLTSLSGGIGSAPIEGDIVILNTAARNTGYPTIDTSGYTSIADLFSDDTRDTYMRYVYKVMGSTPDTSVSVSGQNSLTIQVWRGQNLSNPFDVTPTTATGTDTAVPTPPPITPTTNGSVIIVSAANVSGFSFANIGGAPSGYSNFVNTFGQSEICSTGIASKTWTSGTETPANFTISDADSTQNSWAAVTLALRPFSGTQFSVSDSLSCFEVVNTTKAINFNFLDTVNVSEGVAATKAMWVSIIEGLKIIDLGTAVKGKWSRIPKNTSTFTSQSKNSSIWTKKIK
jgi:hypothetical protein